MSRPRSRALLRALHHPIRAMIGKHIHEADGRVSLPDLCRALDAHPAVVRYHVEVLAACGVISRA